MNKSHANWIGFLLFGILNFANTVHAQILTVKDIVGKNVYDQFGYSVSMPDANTIGVGSLSNILSKSKASYVRVLYLNGTTWKQKGSDIVDSNINNEFGFTVSMPDPNTIAVGAPKNSNTNGLVRVYKWDVTNWKQKGEDILDDLKRGIFGNAVCMPDENTVAIGNYQSGINGSSSGHVSVYNWNGTSWQKKGSNIIGENSLDYSGHSLSMPDINTIAIGAPSNDGNGASSGHVRVYKWDGLDWVQKGIDLDGEAEGDRFGTAVSMSDANTVGVGAPGNDGNGNYSGHVRIYSWNGSSWIQKGLDLDGEAVMDYSGYSVSMPNANIIAIGAPNSDDYGPNSGHVRIYHWNGTKWLQYGNDIFGDRQENYSGDAISMPNAETLAIGAHRYGIETGHVKIYTLGYNAANENAIGQSFGIYPNPGENEIYIKSNTQHVGDTYSIIDNMGKTAITGKITSENTKIDASHLSKGIYIIQLQENTNLSQKLVIY